MNTNKNGVMAPNKEAVNTATIHFMSNQIITQPFNGEIGVDNTHQHTDEKQQNKNLDSIVKEEIDCYTQ